MNFVNTSDVIVSNASQTLPITDDAVNEVYSFYAKVYLT